MVDEIGAKILCRPRWKRTWKRRAENRDGGLSKSDAQLEARRLFGNLTRKQEEARDIWITRYWQNLWQEHATPFETRKNAQALLPWRYLHTHFGHRRVFYRIRNRKLCLASAIAGSLVGNNCFRFCSLIRSGARIHGT